MDEFLFLRFRTSSLTASDMVLKVTTSRLSYLEVIPENDDGSDEVREATSISSMEIFRPCKACEVGFRAN